MTETVDFSVGLVVLVMAGALLLVAGLAKALHGRLLQMGIEEAAGAIGGLVGLLADPAPHDITLVDAGHHSDDARAFVTDVTAAAAAVGFTTLGDLEDRTITRTMPEARTAMRALLSDDGTIIVAAWGRPATPTTPPLRLLELSSELADGRFVETVVAPDLPSLDVGPWILIERHAPGTPLPSLLQRHRARLAECGGAVVAVSDVDGAIQRSHRRVARAAEFRQTIPAFVTRAELHGMAGAEPDIVDRVHALLIQRHGERRV